MKKIKVLHVLNTDSFSGAENVVINIINNGKDEVEGIYVSKDGSIRKVLEENEITFYPVSKLCRKELKTIISQVKPDIIQAHDFTAGIVAACSTLRIPIINHLHNNSPWLKKLNLKSIAFGIFCKSYRQILTVSDSVMNEFVFGKFYQKKTQIVGNPIELGKIRKKSEEICDEKKYDIAFLGRLTEQKNPLFFVKIIYELKKKIPDLQVAVIGEGELRSEVEDNIFRLGLKENIKLHGFLSNPYSVLKKCKVLCMPSKWEGFGLAAVEALALGKPVVAAPVGGLVNIVNENCGELCLELETYVSALEKMLSDQNVYNQKSQGALNRARELENIDQYMNKLIKIYGKIKKDEEN